jgi:hypothetical protein
MTDQDAAFQAGYDDVMRMHAEAQRRGWRVPERIIAREIMRCEHSARASLAGQPLPVLGPRPFPPQWYRGRAAAMREILRDVRGM